MSSFLQLPAPAPFTYRKTSRPYDLFLQIRKSRTPQEGWTQEEFASRRGSDLIRDVLAIRRLAIRDNATKLTSSLVNMIESEIDETVTLFVQELAKREGVAGKSIGSKLINAVLSIFVADGLEELFEEVLKKVFADKGVESRVTAVFKPAYMSTMAHVADKTMTVMIPPADLKEEPTVEDELREQGVLPSANEQVGEPVRVASQEDLPPVTSISIGKPPKREKPLTKKQVERIITRKADKMCAKVTRISETTRKRMRKFFKENIEGKATVGQMITKMREEFKKIEKSRVPTIVRNELAMAANEAQILSFKNTKTLTHCSVIGCQAVEENSPKYKGFPTCNLQNVPVADLEQVEFHINHTGSWVPSGFRRKNGAVPKLRLYNKAGIGAFDDPKAPRHRKPKPKKPKKAVSSGEVD